MEIWVKYDQSITGKLRNQRVFVKRPGASPKEKPLMIEAAADGSLLMRYGDGFARGLLQDWCLAELGTKKPSFADLFAKVDSLNPRPINPKAPAWLR